MDVKQAPVNADAGLLERTEFHREAMAIVPADGDARPGVGFLRDGGPRGVRQRFCTCGGKGDGNCAHLKELSRAEAILGGDSGAAGAGERFRGSVWLRLAAFLGEGCRETPDSVRVQVQAPGGRRQIHVFSGEQGRPLATYLAAGKASVRLLERLGRGEAGTGSLLRSEILERLRLLTMSETERLMAKRGFKTRRQALEEGFWFRLAYHAFREHGQEGVTFEPAIARRSGEFTVLCNGPRGEALLRVFIPRERVRGLLGNLGDMLSNRHSLEIHPIPLKSIFKVSPTTEMDLEVLPLIQVLQANGESAFFERENLEQFRYGDLIYIPEMELLAELEPPGRKARKFSTPVKMVLKKSQVPSFIEDALGGGNAQTAVLLGPDLSALERYRAPEWVEFRPEVLDRNWCWISASYGFGGGSLSLAEIMAARRTGQRYVGTEGGWVDLDCEDLDALQSFLAQLPADRREEGKDGIRLSRLELLRLQAAGPRSVTVTGAGGGCASIANLLNLRPADPPAELRGMCGSLRPYQREGVAWLWYLYENGLGGLLCDDMGLGKTHQIMALLQGLSESDRPTGACLVVAPTTVLSHWEDKLRRFTPGLGVGVYHGGGRELEGTLEGAQVLLTSYGILRRDIHLLDRVEFALAVFDEIQFIKNADTQAYQAAREVRAPVKLGLTGTPIENRLGEIKALMDLVVPGYLDADRAFEERFARPMAEGCAPNRHDELTRILAPFVLRRRKDAVLADLPPKIEDLRTCRLSEKQVRIYREAVAAHAPRLRLLMGEAGAPVPYIHIFALLDLLKQICNHPALAGRVPEAYERYESGKWELFKELLAESLDSGQKVVVYSQYLGMIRIMESYLESLGVGFVSLTGATGKRAKVIRTFNEDPQCRVYVGSLRAGGIGIDLVAASVVIHYDRWWNAAKEDQATDRVHRIGQKRGVQVFKLLTEGTLEEKIAALIEKKRRLMGQVIPETDPGILKQFSREELLELMAMP